MVYRWVTVSLRFDLGGHWLQFQGIVQGVERKGKVVVSAEKIFRQCFGCDMPAYTKILNG